MKRLPISEALCEYIKMLNDEALRYKELLCGTAGEEYYQPSVEAQYMLQVAKNTVAELYADEIDGDYWHIDFDNCELLIENEDKGGACVNGYKNNGRSI